VSRFWNLCPIVFTGVPIWKRDLKSASKRANHPTDGGIINYALMKRE
jgi:hypothetical protein